MGKILGSYLLPHPPIIVPEIGKGEEYKTANTIRAIRQVAEDISRKKPETIILITPHGPLFSDVVSISYGKKLKGNFGKFGEVNLVYEFDNDINIVDKIINNSMDTGVFCAKIDEDLANEYQVELELDHGALVPLHFIRKEYNKFKLVHITYGLLSPIELYRFGMAINRAVKETSTDVVFIASGDLSHKLTKNAPAGYNKRGRDFDEEVVKHLKSGNLQGLMTIDKRLAEAAGECGLRSLHIMCGFLDGYNILTDVLSYEGPFGVGYCVASIEALGESEDHKLLKKLMENEREYIRRIREKEDQYVKLARKSLEYYIKNNKVIDIPNDLNDEILNKRAGVFVSIKKDGELRGCIGTIEATKNNIAEEIISNAIKAGTEDPRFYPVEEDELESLVYSVDILKEPEKIDSLDKLDVYRYGVIVKKGFKSGLLLPNLEGVDTPEEQVKIALQKAGISPNEAYTMYRFEVERHY